MTRRLDARRIVAAHAVAASAAAALVIGPRVAAARVVAALVLLALAPAGGCTIVHQTSGRAVPDARAALAIGRSTKADALSVLGPPYSVRRQFDGDLLTWRRDDLRSERLLLVPLVPVYERFEGHADADVVTLLFDRSGVLAGIGEQRDIR